MMQSALLGQLRLIGDRDSDISVGRIYLTQNVYVEIEFLRTTKKAVRRLRTTDNKHGSPKSKMAHPYVHQRYGVV